MEITRRAGCANGWVPYLLSNGPLLAQPTEIFKPDSIQSTKVKAAQRQLKQLPDRKLLGPDIGVFYTGFMATYHCTSDEALLVDSGLELSKVSDLGGWLVARLVVGVVAMAGSKVA